MLGAHKRRKELEALVEKLKLECSKRLELINSQTGKIELLKSELQQSQADCEAKQVVIDTLTARLRDLGFDVDALLAESRWEQINRHLYVGCKELDIGPKFTNRVQVAAAQQYIARLLPTLKH